MGIGKGKTDLFQISLGRDPRVLFLTMGKMVENFNLKSLGGLGFKNLFLLSKSLATKSRCILLTTSILLMEVFMQKFIRHDSLEDWIRFPNKVKGNISTLWRLVINYLDLSTSGLTWRIGHGHKIRLGYDPWKGSGEIHILSQNIIPTFGMKATLELYQIENPIVTYLWIQGWILVDNLNIPKGLQENWR